MESDIQAASGNWNVLTICSLFVLSTVFYFLRSANGTKLPTINDKGLFEFSDKRIKQNFVLNGRRLLVEGLKKFNGKPFRILTDFGPTTVLSPEYAQEIRNDGNLNHAQFVAKVGWHPYVGIPYFINHLHIQLVHATYPGIEGFYEFAFGGDILQDVIKLKLTQALGMLHNSKL
jgi:hypothetical protein